MLTSNDPTVTDFGIRGDATGPQIGIYLPANAKLTKRYTSNWYTKVRDMRKDPTISLIRDLVLGPILSAGWSIGHKSTAPVGAVSLIEEKFLPFREYLIENVIQGLMDFGWQAFEKIWKIDEAGNAILDKVKPLLQDITTILVDIDTGEYIGIWQPAMMTRPEVWLTPKNTILCNINVEGTYWYGRPIMASIESAYDGWNEVNEIASKYDKKVSGSHWVVRYPVGTTPYGASKVPTDNYLIAKAMIDALEGSGAIFVPRNLDRTLSQLNDLSGKEDAWIIELLSDESSQQGAFIDRLSYYDALKSRALGFPERSVFQGKFGTKAEAETHADLAVVIAEYRHNKITQQISNQAVNDYLKYNFGDSAVGTVYLKTAPIADDLRKFLREIFTTLLSHNPRSALEKIDRTEVLSRLGLPTNNGDKEDSSFIFDAE